LAELLAFLISILKHKFIIIMVHYLKRHYFHLLLL